MSGFPEYYQSQPLPIPGASPDEAPFVVRGINADWMPILIGMVTEQLAIESAWDSTDPAVLAETLSRVDELIYALQNDYEVPTVTDYVGQIETCAVATLPPGRLWCDGSTHNRVDYPDLYAALDSAFIVDADTFTVPDLRGRVPVGAGGQWAVGANGGESEHTLTIAEMPAHAHSENVFNLFATTGTPWPVGVTLATTNSGGVPANTNNNWMITSPVGSNAAHNNMPPFLTVRYAIISSLP